MRTNFGIGLNGAIDIRGKIDRNWLSDEENSSSTVIGIGPKFSLVPNRIAFFLPAVRGSGDGASNTWQMQPTLFLTQPIIPEKLEVTLSTKYLANLYSECGGQFAANLGISASKDFNKMAWRLEFGKIFKGGSIGQLSLGKSFVFSPKK
ncbi:hypothetical protein AAGF08_12710 [Algoriphagus sp. SE2]|uniref:hypothetical protein n=1 Tax=Algoriphagus sp. SE2 TaxID=3141536 RepID=UPI0031CCEE97